MTQLWKSSFSMFPSPTTTIVVRNQQQLLCLADMVIIIVHFPHLPINARPLLPH